MRCIAAVLAIIFRRRRWLKTRAPDSSARGPLISFRLKVIGGRRGAQGRVWPQSDWPDYLFARASCRCFHIEGGQAAPDEFLLKRRLSCPQ